MLTLQDLKWIVKEPEKEEKLPTARYLLEHGKRVVSMENGGEVQLLVFREGYALYRIGKYTTVFPIHSCGNYCYENNGQKICVNADFFEGKEWYVRLLLEGEDRLAKNRETYHKERVVSYHAVSEEWFFLTSPVLPPLEQLIDFPCISGTCLGFSAILQVNHKPEFGSDKDERRQAALHHKGCSVFLPYGLQGFLFVLRSQASSCNVFPTLRMEIAEPPTADLECNMIVV